MLRDIPPTSREREVYKGNHEYEALEKYNQQNNYDDIEAPSDSSKVEPEKLSLDGDYESTPCPAYDIVSVITNYSIHGNDEVETSSIGSTSVQEDHKKQQSDSEIT